MSRSSWIRKPTRLAIFFRDGFRCVWCLGETDLGLDHLVPGGNHDPKNLVAACHMCNSRRRNMPLPQWYEKLRAEGKDTKQIRLRVYRARHRPINRDLGLLAHRAKLTLDQLRALWPRTRRVVYVPMPF